MKREWPRNAAGARKKLIALLRLAYSAELAAARAYGGHWRSVRRPTCRDRIRQIEAEELAHRARLGEMLAELGARPSRLRDAWMTFVGLTIALSCFVGGYYLPMYGAGRIERRNIREYEDAARLAHLAGCRPYVDELLRMAEIEWDHERFFHDEVRAHWLHRLTASWSEPSAREEIRASFAEFCEQAHPSPTPCAA